MNKERIKVAIYCRVGHKGQLIKEQEEGLKEYCTKNNYEVVNIYSDNGYSANDNNRPGYNLMLEDMKNNRFDMIITKSADRLTRNIIEFGDILNLVIKSNCMLNIINDKMIYNDGNLVSNSVARYFALFTDYAKRLKNE